MADDTTRPDPAEQAPGDLNPLLTELKNLDPLGFAQDVVHDAKPEIIEEVIDELPDADMDTLNETVQESLRRSELGVGLMAVHAAANAKETAFRAAGDTYHNMPLEEAQEILRAEGFERVLEERYVEPFREYLHSDGERYSPGERVYEVWFNPEGTLVELDTSEQMFWEATPPIRVGLTISHMRLEYNWSPHPSTFVYYSNEPGYDEEKGPSPEWREHVNRHNWHNFTSSGHFLTVSDEEWAAGERVYIGSHHFVDGGFRHALHNLRANGRFEPRWLEAPSPPMFEHWGDRALVEKRHYDDPAVLQAVKDGQELELRRRYNALPEAVKDCVGPYHTWDSRLEDHLRTRAELEAAQQAGVDYLNPGQSPDAPELPSLE